jgi:hypothetical protein
MTGATKVAKPVSTSSRLHSAGKHRKQPKHRKEPVGQRVSAGRLASACAAAAVAIAALVFAGLFAGWVTEDSIPVADAGHPPGSTQNRPVEPSLEDFPAVAPVNTPAAPFPSDDRGFIDSSARCSGSEPAYAIGRTLGSLVVICGERTGQLEYLGVRLSDAAVLRTYAHTNPTRTFVAQKAGVLYAVSAAELKVTSGDTVIKREPMIEYREVQR